jgi:hypothetical protein
VTLICMLPMRLRRCATVSVAALVLVAGGTAGAQGVDSVDPPPSAPEVPAPDPPPPPMAPRPGQPGPPVPPAVAPPGGDTGLPPPPVRGPQPPPGEGEGADPGPPAPPMADPTPRVRVLLAEIEALERDAEFRGEREVLAEKAEARAAAERDLEAAEQGVADAEEDLRRARQQLSGYAVEAFMYASGGTAPAVRELGLYQRRQTEQLTGSIHRHQQVVVEKAADRLTAAERKRDRRRRAVEASEAALVEQERVLEEAEARVEEIGREIQDAKRADVVKVFDRDDDGWKLTIMGDSVFNPEELAEWFRQRDVASRAAAPIEDLARFYIEEGEIEGVRGDMAFAQAVLETGSFTNADTIRFNNYAGIGHCDSCPSGFAFESPQIGVRGQIQHVKSYANRDAEFANPLVDKRLRGPSGCCATWAELTGVYATDTNYGPKILSIYQLMLEWLVPRRVMTALAAPA